MRNGILFNVNSSNGITVLFTGITRALIGLISMRISRSDLGCPRAVRSPSGRSIKPDLVNFEHLSTTEQIPRSRGSNQVCEGRWKWLPYFTVIFNDIMKTTPWIREFRVNLPEVTWLARLPGPHYEMAIQLMRKF